MEAESSPSVPGLLSALEAKNSELLAQLLDKYGSSVSSAKKVAEQLDEVIDFLDRLERSSFSESTASSLYKQGITVLCTLISASEPETLRDRSTFLLSYLVSSLWLEIPQLASSLWLLWLADRRAAELALREHGLTSPKPSVKLASVKELESWVDAVQGKIAFRKFTPSMVRLLRDECPEVRLAAYSLLVKFFAKAKAPAREDLADIMRKNQLNDALREKLFAAIRKTAGESISEQSKMDNTKPPSRPETSQSGRSNSSPTPPDLKTNRIATLAIKNDPLYPMQNLEPLHNDSDAEFMTRTSELLASFEGKETEGNWSSRQIAVQTYRRMLRSQPQPSKAAIRESFKLLQRRLSDALLSMRTTLVMDTCQAVKDTAQSLSQSLFYSDLFDPLLDNLAKVAGGVKRITAKAANIAICAFIIESPALSNRQFQCILQESRNLKPHARESAYYWLNCALVTSEISSLAPRQFEIEQIMLKAIADAAPAGRIQGRDLYWVATVLWPELAANVEKRLSPTALKTLQKSMPNQNSMASPSRPASRPRSRPPAQLPIRPISQLASGSSHDSSDRKSPVENEGPRTPSPLQSKASFMFENQLNNALRKTPRNSAPASPRLTKSDFSRTPSATPSRASSRPGSRVPSCNNSPDSNLRKELAMHSADPLAQSIADLSVQDVELPDHTQLAAVDFHSRASIVEATRRNAVEVLRQLASANISTTLARSVVTIIRDASPEFSSSSAVGRFIHNDVEQATQTQREGYLRLLRLLDYESVSEVELISAGRQTNGKENPENLPKGIFSPVKQAEGIENESLHGKLFEFPSTNLSTVGSPIRDQIYVDSESGEDSSNLSVISSASSLSLSAASHQPSANTKLARQEFLSPFPSSLPECKLEISKMVEAVKTCSCTSENLAKLAVLVTAASAATNLPSSPLHSVVTTWRQHFTYDMQLRDAILPFLSRKPDSVNIETVIVGLVVLRALLLSDSVPHAAVYLDPVACIRTLCSVSDHFANQSLELDDKLLPELADIVAKRSARSTSSHAFFDYLSSVLGSDSSTIAGSIASKVLCLRAATQATELCFPQFTSSERQTLEQMVNVGIQNNDARVRKEVYPLLLVMNRCDENLADNAARALSGGQKQLFSYYLETGRMQY